MLTLQDRKTPLSCLAFSLDGQRLATAGAGGAIRVWDLATQRLSARFSTFSYWNNDAVLFMPDGKELLVLVNSQTYRFAADGKPLGCWPRPSNNPILAAAVSSDGKRLCLGVNRFKGALHQFALPEFEPIWKQRAHLAGSVRALAYSRDGRLLACGLDTGDVSVCNALTGMTVYKPSGAGSEVKSIALSPTGKFVAWCAATQLHLWQLDPLQQILRHSLGRTHFHSVAFHPSGDFFATANGDGKIDYWDARTGEHRQAFDWGVGKLHDVTFDDAGDRAACCSQTGKVVVWDVDR